MKYKDFLGSVQFSADDNVFFGKLEGVDDLITFEGKTVDELNIAFHNAVDDYLIMCKEAGKEIKKSYKGTINIKISSEL